MAEQFRVEEVLNGDSQSVAQFFNGRDRGAVVPSADDIVHRGLGNTAHIAEFVDGYVLLTAQLQYAFLYCFADVHKNHR